MFLLLYLYQGWECLFQMTHQTVKSVICSFKSVKKNLIVIKSRTPNKTAASHSSSCHSLRLTLKSLLYYVRGRLGVLKQHMVLLLLLYAVTPHTHVIKLRQGHCGVNQPPHSNRRSVRVRLVVWILILKSLLNATQACYSYAKTMIRPSLKGKVIKKKEKETQHIFVPPPWWRVYTGWLTTINWPEIGQWVQMHL